MYSTLRQVGGRGVLHKHLVLYANDKLANTSTSTGLRVTSALF